jgi:hypothetical protein
VHKRAGGVAQVVEHLPDKIETLSSNPGAILKVHLSKMNSDPMGSGDVVVCTQPRTAHSTATPQQTQQDCRNLGQDNADPAEAWLVAKFPSNLPAGSLDPESV